ncbi:MAG TPA: DUF6159 family protein [Verrucomicrobiae bacterium]|nr:DUF6159 family protein [Verrucomicrobiae bacterium]
MNSIGEKLVRSWQLFKSSVRVIGDHPKLLVFPFVTGLLTLGIALFFFAPVVLVVVAPHWIHGGVFQAMADRIGFVRVRQGAASTFQIQPLGSMFLAGMYLLNLFLATMSSVAFNSQIFEALAGRPVSFSSGIEAACRRWKSVLFWSLLAGTVGLLIKALEDKLSFIGKIVGGFLGLAWSVASIFAIPILVCETSITNPFEVVSRSARTIKATWGEMLAGYLGMQGTNLLFLWGSILLWVGTGAAALAFSNPWILLVVGAPWLVSLMAYSYLANIASRVYLCALYVYASEGRVPDPYDASMMAVAFRTRKTR